MGRATWPYRADHRRCYEREMSETNIGAVAKGFQPICSGPLVTPKIWKCGACGQRAQKDFEI